MLYGAETPSNRRRVVAAEYIEYYSVTTDDSHVVQCNVSNIHGYLFTNAYLNVLGKTCTPINITPSF